MRGWRAWVRRSVSALTALLLLSPAAAYGKTYTEAGLRNIGVQFVAANAASICSPLAETTAPTGTPGGNLDISRIESVEDRIAQTFIVGFSNNDPALVKRIVQKYKLGGVVIQGHNDNKTFNKAFFDGMNAVIGTPLIVAVDQEGGKVQRYDLGTAVGNQPSAKQMGGMSDAEVEAIGKKTGDGLTSLGVNVDLAPVLDLDNGANKISTLERSFSSDPDVVLAKASAFARGLNAGGVKPVFKHFPGHGFASGTSDSDSGIVTTPPLADLKLKDLIPYQQLVNKYDSAIMLGNLIVPGLTEDKTPTSISPATVDLLRNKYGFSGMITTDDLTAGAISQQGIGITDAVRRALNAGVDAPLFSFTSEADLQNTITQVKNLVDVTRINDAANKVISFKNKQPSAASVATTVAADSLPTSSKAYVLGDSITERSAREIVGAFSNKAFSVTVNASASRSINGPGISGDKLSGLQAVDKDAAIIGQADAVVIALGTNGGETEDSISKLLTAIKAKNANAKLFWVDTIAVGRPDYTATKTSNTVIYSQAPIYSYTVISWAKAVDPASDPKALTGTEKDPNSYILPYAGQSASAKNESLGVHPTSAGATAFAQLLANALANGVTETVQTADGCCTVSTSPTVGLSASGTITGVFNGGKITLPPSWVPLLAAAARDVGVDPAFLAAILGNEVSWTPPEAFIQNPTLKDHGVIAGPFQFDTRNIAKFVANSALDGNHDGTVDVRNPADSAYMAAAYLKEMGATMTTPLGQEGDYAVAKKNQDGKVTIRTIAAHYNQGYSWSSNDAVKGNNPIRKYMDQASQNTGTIRASGAFNDITGATATSSGCGDSSATDALSDKFVIYLQSDPEWATVPYGIIKDSVTKKETPSTIAAGGCGPSAMAMIITFLTGERVTPAMTAAFGRLPTSNTQNDTGGSNGSLAPILAAHWGLNALPVNLDVNEINKALDSGGLVILGGTGGSPFTTEGHIIVIRAQTADGKWRIADSNVRETNEQSFDPAAILAAAAPGTSFVVSK